MKPASSVILPQEIRSIGHRLVDELSKLDGKPRGVASGLKTLDAIVNPLAPGKLMVIMGRPSNGKSALMMHYTREASSRWVDSGGVGAAPPVFVSAEMAIEEVLVREISHFIPVNSVDIERGIFGDWSLAHEAIDKMFAIAPMIFIGHSNFDDKKRPRLSVDAIDRMVADVVEIYGAPPILLCLDYAQRLKLDKITRDRRMEVSEIVESVKDLSLRHATPTILGSQVGRQVDERNPPVPDMADAKETANLEETADTILGVMRPSRYYEVGETIPRTDLKCREELFYVYVVKQRQGEAGRGVWCWFDMSVLYMTDLEMQRVNLEDY